MMPDVVKKWSGDKQEGLLFFCPGCKEPHSVTTSPGRWSFNGDMVRPTLSPSILVTGHISPLRCHSFVKDGQIQFLSDCDHDLKNQTVPLPDWNTRKSIYA